MSDNLLGTMHPTESCPKCSSRIMVNPAGNRWCTNDDCDFHIRNGQVVTAAMVRELGSRCPVKFVD